MSDSLIQNIFKDTKIVELSSVLAGPLVGSYFAELGAEVLKIENKRTGGDVTRSWFLDGEDKSTTSAYYQAANYGKESIFLDLREKKDRNILYEYISDADIVINNINLDSAQRLGIHPADLHHIKADLIYAQLDGFDGEDSRRSAYDIAMQAESGFLSMTGLDTSETSDKSASTNALAKIPVALIDVLASHQLIEAILVAFLHKLKSGKGTYVRASLYGVALTSLKNQATNFLLEEHIPKPMGTLHPNIAPYGEILTFKDDTSIVLAVGTDRQFYALLNLLKIEGMKEEFLSNTQRISKRKELHKLLQDRAARITFTELEKKFIESRIPFGKIKNLREVWETKEAQAYLQAENGIPRHSAVKFMDLEQVSHG